MRFMRKFYTMMLAMLCFASMVMALPAALKLQLPEDDGDIDTDTPVVGDIYYLLNHEDKTAQVTGSASTLTALSIPETIEVTSGTYTVTSVATNAFLNNKTITSVTIPATITDIYYDAFRNMTNLRTLNIDDLKAWIAISFENGNANPLYNVFPTNTSQWGKVYVAGEEVTELVIPEGITYIGRSFYGFKALKSVTLPSTLVKIEAQAFNNCEGLTEVTVPAALESIGNMAFYGAKNIEAFTCYAAIPPTCGYMNFDSFSTKATLYVPEASVEAYKAALYWEDFTNIVGVEVSEGDFGDASIEGEWNFTLDWHYAGDYSLGVQTEAYTATLDGNTVTFENQYGEKFVAKFTAENTLTFDLAAVGAPATYTRTQNPFTDGTNVTDAGIDGENFVFESFAAEFKPEAGTIIFPEGVGLAFGNANAAGEFQYYDDGFDFISAQKVGAGQLVTRRWDFTTWSEATVANLKADAAESANTGWSDDEKNNGTTVEGCFWATNTMEADEIYGLSANKVIIDELKGLKFTGDLKSRNLAIAVDYPETSLGTYEGGSYLWLGGSNKKFFTIPAVKGGSTIKMGVESHKPAEGRGVELYIGDTKIAGPAVPGAYEDQTWTVPEGETVDIIVDNTSGCHVYYIEVEQDQDALLAIAKEDLATVLAAVETINPDDYTEETIAALIDAMEIASSLGGNATADEIAEATYALLNAKAALEIANPDKPLTYTVKEVYGDIIFAATAEGEGLAGDLIKVPYHYYNVDENGKLYKRNPDKNKYDGTATYFTYRFTLENDAQEENVEYEETETENVVFLAEGEDIEGMASITTGNAAIRCSNEAAGSAAEDVVITTLEPGVYTLHANLYDPAKGGGTEFTFKADGNEYTVAAAENFSEHNIENVVITTKTDLVFAACAASKGLDLIYIVKTGEYDPSGINNVKAEFENGDVYNLHGQKVTKAQKGIFIINGKKVVLK